MAHANVRIVVSGLVQGVGFRYYTYRQAIGLGLTGYAKNLPSGQVEIIACGDRGMINELIEIVRVGPSYASVSDVNVQTIEVRETFDTFGIR